MTLEELINKIKEAQKEFYDKNPCKNCVGNGCDDCRHCDEASLRYELSSKLFKLKEEFKKTYNIDYDDYINNQKPQSQYSLNKELLLKDLCSRLPYRVKVNNEIQGNFEVYGICENLVFGRTEVCHIDFPVETVKPYLFPLSSMTEEQKKEYNYWKHDIPVCRYEYGDVVEELELFESPESFNYLIENHFDYYGLIPKGLALDATGLNIY